MDAPTLTALVALASALLGSIVGPLIKSLCVDPTVEAGKKMRDNFQVLLTNLEGFSHIPVDQKKISEICLQYRMAWLYASDEVIRAINGWLQHLKVPPPSKDTVEWAAAVMILQMRKEIYKNTSLQEKDFLLLGSSS